MILLLALAGSPAHAACPAPTTAADVLTPLADAAAKFGAMEVDGFLSDTDQAFAALPCLSEKADRALAAEVHRMRGLRAMVDRDPDLARRAFAAARAIEPGYGFPVSVVPEDNLIRAEYSALNATTGALAPVPEPGGGALSFDGRDTGNRRPTEFPTLVQYVDADGKVVTTAYLLPGAGMIDYPLKSAAPDPLPIEPPKVAKDKGGVNVPMLGGAGVFAVAAGGMWAASAIGHNTFEEATTVEDLDRGRAMANNMGYGAVASGIIAAGLGTGAFVVSARW